MPFRRFGRPGLLGLAARTAVVAGTASAVSGAMAGGRQRRSQAEYEQQQYEAAQQQAQVDAAARQAAASYAPAPAAASPVASAPVDLVAEIQKLAALRDAGALTDAEFSAAKSRLLA
jgi:hypothetical protein